MLRYFKPWLCLLFLILSGCSAPTSSTLTTAATFNQAEKDGKHSVTLKAEGFYLDGKAKLLRGGAFQWFRIPPSEWEDRLRRFKAAGFNTLDLYVPWRIFEPVEGQFDFKTYDIVAFLKLAQKEGLYVYFRPGPYITNEMDGGGVPAWVFTKSSKKLFSATELDGTMNLRTEDADFMAAVDRYWSALITQVKPYLFTQGGPIVLFGIENEYTWFRPFFEIDKFATYQGEAERDVSQKLDRVAYLGGLRDIAQRHGVDVPIATCPGQSWAALVDEVPGILPIPNYYTTDAGQAEYAAFKQLTDMHDPKKSSYTNFPSGTTETERTVSTLRRQIMGGLDAVFHFNIVGAHQEGRLNSVVINPPGGKNLGAIVDSFTRFKPDQIAMAFLEMPIAYFHGVQDYYGAISASGSLHEKFHSFRRTNLFFDSFESLIADAGMTKRTSSKKLKGEDKRIRVNAPNIGYKDPDAGKKFVNYWLELKDGAALLGLLNDTRASVVVKRGSLIAFGETLPRYTSFTIPTESYPGNRAEVDSLEIQYDFLMPLKFPLLTGWTLDYSTSEILKFQKDGSPLLIVYGFQGGEGELRLRADGLTLESLPEGFKERSGPDGTLTVTYTHQASPQRFKARDAQGIALDVVVLNTALAGRTWFLDDAKTVVMGPRYIDESAGMTTAEIDDAFSDIWSFGSPALLNLPRIEERNGFTHYRYAARAPLQFNIDLQKGMSRTDFAESQESYDDDAFEELGAEPSALERHGIYEGFGWYRSNVTLTPEQAKKPGALYIESASDFVGLYINGRYLLTLSPVGTAIDSGNPMKSYQFSIPSGVLRTGPNTVAFRVEIWGHGSFLWPRGTLDRIPLGSLGYLPILGSSLSIPSLGYDSLRGLEGTARLGQVPLVDWRLRKNLTGEDQGYAQSDLNDPSWNDATLPLKLPAGGVVWYRTKFLKSQLPNPNDWHAPVALTLKGFSSKATIYVNGRLIGRWLSDTEWMKRGAWTRPVRDMWMNTSPDSYPISYADLKDGENDLAIVFEDTSDQTGKDATGTITSVTLGLSAEEKNGDALQAVTPARVVLKGP